MSLCESHLIRILHNVSWGWGVGASRVRDFVFSYQDAVLFKWPNHLFEDCWTPNKSFVLMLSKIVVMFLEKILLGVIF